MEKKSKSIFIVAVGIFILGFACALLVLSVAKNISPLNLLTFRIGAPTSFASIVEAVKPSVVNISTSKEVRVDSASPNNRAPRNKYFSNDFPEQSSLNALQRNLKQFNLGSGVIISEDGYILTNCHVIDKADKINVRLSNCREYDAAIIGRDPKTDIALLKIKNEERLPAAEFDDSDKSKIGDWVIAIGNPFGLEQTVTAGIISAKGRVIGAGPFDDFIQTDASINQGNSGGPLFNLNGKIVGINTAIVVDGQGIGFAVPINLVKSVLPDLKSKGRVVRGWIGISVEDIPAVGTKNIPARTIAGAVVADVFKGEPAASVGLAVGDIITEINGKKVNNSHELLMLIAYSRVGDSVTVKVMRGTQEVIFNIMVAERTDKQDVVSVLNNATAGDTIGITVQEVTTKTNKRSKKGFAGILVTSVSREAMWRGRFLSEILFCV